MFELEVFVVKVEEEKEYEGHKYRMCTVLVGEEAFKVSTRVDLTEYKNQDVRVKCSLRSTSKGLRMKIEELA